VVVVVLLRLWRLEGCVVVVAAVEVFSVAFRSREEDRRAVSRAWRSAAMRWARGTSSMRRKSRVEAATLGSEVDEGSEVCVVVAMVGLCVSCVLLLLLWVLSLTIRGGVGVGTVARD
jgi:hypothetical protein